MIYDAITAAICYNTMSNMDKIIKELGLRQGQFLKNWCYNSKATFSRKALDLKDEVKEPDVDQMIADAKEVDRMVQDAMKVEWSKGNVVEYDKTMKSLLRKEKFVINFLMMVDSVLLFENRTKDMVQNILAMVFYIKGLEENRASEDEIMARYFETDFWADCYSDEENKNRELEANYYSLYEHPWFVVDIENGKGLVYQLEYLKHLNSTNQSLYENRRVFSSIRDKMSDPYVVLSSLGCMALKDVLEELPDRLRAKSWLGAETPIILPSRIHELLHFGEVDVRQLLPKEEKVEDYGLQNGEECQVDQVEESAQSNQQIQEEQKIQLDNEESAEGDDTESEVKTVYQYSVNKIGKGLEEDDEANLFENEYNEIINEFQNKLFEQDELTEEQSEENENQYMILLVSSQREAYQWALRMPKKVFERTVFMFKKPNSHYLNFMYMNLKQNNGIDLEAPNYYK